MSYEPSHRKPPRQERWPDATPGEGWPAYRDVEAGQAWGPADAFAGRPDGRGGGDGVRYGRAGSGYRTAANGYGATDGFRRWDDTGRSDGNGGWDGYAQPGHEFTGSAGYLVQDEYPGSDPDASSVLVAPDTAGEWWRRADRDDDEADRDGLIVGVVTGLLAVAVAIGVATLAAAFVRPQASPVSVVGGVVLGRLPAGLKHAAVAHLGVHAGAVLLLAVAGVIALVLGAAARRNTGLAVAGLAAFGLLAAFVAVTRPGSRASDVVAPAIGVAAGIIALMWLARASAPVAPAPVTSARRRADAGGGRRAR
jgi:hypothetical protein